MSYCIYEFGISRSRGKPAASVALRKSEWLCRGADSMRWFHLTVIVVFAAATVIFAARNSRLLPSPSFTVATSKHHSRS